MYMRVVIITACLSSIITVFLLASAVFVYREHFVLLVADSMGVSVSTSQSDTVQPQVSTESSQSVIADMVSQTNDAVVSVVVRREVPIYENFYREYDPFGGLFGGGRGLLIPEVREQGREWREVGGGSGFVVSADGLLVTNRHVVDDEEAMYSVVFSDGQTYDAQVVAKDSFFDIAILQIQADTEQHTFSYLTFGDSATLRLGETVVAIGNALSEFNNTVSVGVVSGLSRSITARGQRGMVEQLEQVIQTDAAINPGNSGGPLLNMAGEVIGVNVATSLQGENIGFALPSDAVAHIVQSVKETGEIVRPFLGVQYTMLNEHIADMRELPLAYGALLVTGVDPNSVAVVPNSPADQAGLQVGDIILQIDDHSLADSTLARILRLYAVADRVELTVWRDGETFTVETELGRAPN